MINAIVCCHSLSSSFLSHFQYVQEGHIWGSQTSKEMEKMGLSQKKKQNKSYWTSFNPLPFILGCWPRKVRPVWVLPCFCPDVRLKISQTKLKIQGEAQNVTRKSYRKRCEKLTHFSGNVRHIRLKLDRMLHHYYRAYMSIHMNWMSKTPWLQSSRTSDTSKILLATRLVGEFGSDWFCSKPTLLKV